MCDCGQRFFRKVVSVTKNKNVSCNNCKMISSNWFNINKTNLRNLEFPVKINGFPSGVLCTFKRTDIPTGL